MHFISDRFLALIQWTVCQRRSALSSVHCQCKVLSGSWETCLLVMLAKFTESLEWTSRVCEESQTAIAAPCNCQSAPSWRNNGTTERSCHEKCQWRDVLSSLKWSDKPTFWSTHSICGFSDGFRHMASRPRDTLPNLRWVSIRDVNLAVWCLTYQVLQVSLVCLFSSGRGDRSYRQAIGWPNAFWNSGGDQSALAK
jgi:hypothetical protein